MSATEVIEQFKSLPSSERAQVAKFVVENDDSWIPESFKQGMADAEAGRFVDLDTRSMSRIRVRSLIRVSSIREVGACVQRRKSVDERNARLSILLNFGRVRVRSPHAAPAS